MKSVTGLVQEGKKGGEENVFKKERVQRLLAIEIREKEGFTLFFEL